VGFVEYDPLDMHWTIVQIVPATGHCAVFAQRPAGNKVSVYVKSVICWALLESKHAVEDGEGRSRRVEAMIVEGEPTYVQDFDNFLRYLEPNESIDDHCDDLLEQARAYFERMNSGRVSTTE
jgi:hypothetical protein